ncbi:uncharacterized protein PV07_04488 [Cladophialophora immunda]|uniref:SET domain-containing protein n=1 Tax=Cladophialophora immunda TaxID=569365 RepID=A0A0D2CP63_9EURO|nr:uncharacterized protein PV07_04488 [Cladophialophora immunda]KIW32983.1 hypothetical protein PV07_04488 [Cladophialophora immunda]OQV07103.1 hypothetical protein CLAIMM_11587 [Cladophialophora immunda]
MPLRQPTTALPKNWPKEIIYLSTLHIPPPLSPDLLQTTTRPSSPSPSSPPIIPAPSPGPLSPLVQIKPITDPSHPAYTQHGLFATRALPPSSLVILYLGTLHSSSTPIDPASDYDLSLDRELDLAIDASRRGNEARFINDYRGVRPEGPNAEFKDCWVEVAAAAPNGKWERRIGVFVLSPGKAGKGGGKRAKGIAKGEEIVVSYGKGFWRARQHEEMGQWEPKVGGQEDG